MSQYSDIVRRQRRADGWLTPEALAHAYRRMVMTPRVLAQIGPAVSSGNSFLIYGQPGNGKTFLAEALGGLDDSCIYVPYAIESQGSIIQVFDPVYHQPVQDTVERSVLACEHQYDQRWVKCRQAVHRYRRRAYARNAGPEIQLPRPRFTTRPTS